LTNVANNPYSTPEAPVDDPSDEAAIADRIQKRITQAWITGVVSGAIALILAALMVVGSNGMPKETILPLGDLVLVAGLSYGIYRKSRACAVVMFAYSLIF
jgi:serine/threonine-protein kinase